MTSTALPADWLLGSPGRRRCPTWLNQDLPSPGVITLNFSLLDQFVSVHRSGVYISWNTPNHLYPFIIIIIIPTCFEQLLIFPMFQKIVLWLHLRYFILECFFFKWLSSAIPDCIVMHGVLYIVMYGVLYIVMYGVLYISCYVILSLRNIWLRVYVIKFIACQTRYLLWIYITLLLWGKQWF